jgi:hypothetical protein
LEEFMVRPGLVAFLVAADRSTAAAPIRATARAEGRFEHGQLDVGEVHAVEYDGDPTDVSR